MSNLGEDNYVLNVRLVKSVAEQIRRECELHNGSWDWRWSFYTDLRSVFPGLCVRTVSTPPAVIVMILCLWILILLASTGQFPKC